MLMDITTTVRVADLRREIDGIQELSNLFHSKKYHTYQERAAQEKRKIRLQEIKQQLAALRLSP